MQEDLVGVGVADAGEDALVGQRALQGVAGFAQLPDEAPEVDGDDFETSGVECGQRVLAPDQPEGGALVSARLGQRAACPRQSRTRRAHFDDVRLSGSPLLRHATANARRPSGG